jgi:glycerate kinase
MKIMIAPDSFKGSLSSEKIIHCIEETAYKHFNDLEIVRVPIADGGEGTVDSIVAAVGGVYRKIEVMGPIGKKIIAKYGIINNDTAVIEMAEASGLTLISEAERNPLITTTYGTGEIIKDALDNGIRKIIIGIGGSATNDGGIGAAQALGIQFFDSNEDEVGFGGGELGKIAHISTRFLDKRIKECDITVICDVSNTLTGERGATLVYGPQKGGTSEMLSIIEAGMKSYSAIINKELGIDVDSIPGSGAAGGLGASLVVFFGAMLKPGIETILNILNFDKLLEGVDLVVTGEGRIDGQSIYGKVPIGIAKYCSKKNIRVAAIVGSMGKDCNMVYDFGIDSIITTINRDMTISEAISSAEVLLKDAADRMFRFIKIGIDIGEK